MYKKSSFAFCLALVLLLAAYAFAQSSGGYHVMNKFAVGGEGGWDYLTTDEPSHRLYVTRGTRVMVIDTETGKVVGEIPNTEGVHGVAVAPELNRGFASCGRSGTVKVFDLKTFQSIADVKAGRNPDAIIYDPKTKRVFAFNGGSQDATAIDAKTNAVVGTIALGGKPEFAVSDDAGKVFVNIEDKSEIVAFDANKLTVLKRFSIAPGEEPSGLAIDRKHHRLFAGCSNKLMVVADAESGKVVATLPIGSGVDAVAFDDERRLAFSSNGEGTLTVIHEDAPAKFSVVENVPTQRSARTMALDERTHRVYLAAAEFGVAPRATPQNPRPRPPVAPNSFTILVVGR